MARAGRGKPKLTLREQPEEFDVALLRSGDPAEWLRLYEDVSRKLNVSLHARGLGHEWDDIVQETFLRAVDHIHSFNPNKGTVREWVFGIARNLRRDTLRMYRDKPTHGDAGLDRVPSGNTVEQADLRIDLNDARATLTDVERDAFDLHRVQGMKFDEAAAITGRSVAAMKMASSRADQRLRDRLK